MKKLLSIIIVVALIGCSRGTNTIIYFPSYKDDPIRKEIVREQLWEKDPIAAEMLDCGTKLSRMEFIDSCLKDKPFPGGGGHWLIMRSSDPEPPDTIVDGIGYRRDL